MARPLLIERRMFAPHAPGGLQWTRLQVVWVSAAVVALSFVPSRATWDVPPRDASSDSRPPGTWVLYDEVLEANGATAADFELLPAVGPGIARRLVDEREARSGFCSTGEIAAIVGRRWNALAPLVSVRPARRCSSSSTG